MKPCSFHRRMRWRLPGRGLEILPVNHLRKRPKCFPAGNPTIEPLNEGVTIFPNALAGDLAEVKGAAARRSLEIAAAGGHHLLLMGPPEQGNHASPMCRGFCHDDSPGSHRVNKFIALLALEAWSRLLKYRPFRHPHHSLSDAGLWEGVFTRPGEISTHHGCFSIVPEFRRRPWSPKATHQEGEILIPESTVPCPTPVVSCCWLP